MSHRIVVAAVAASALFTAGSANATTTFTAAELQSAAAGAQAMRELNLITFGNLTSGAEVEGKAFIGGNVSGSNENFGIGSSAHPGQGFASNGRATLTVGGDLGTGVNINNGLNGLTGTNISSGLASVADIGGNVTGQIGVNVPTSKIRVGGSFNNQNFNPNANKTVAYGTTATNVQAQDAPYVVNVASLADPTTGLKATIAAQKQVLATDLKQLSVVLASLSANAAFNVLNHNNIFVEYGAGVVGDGFAVINVNAADILGFSGTLNFNLPPLGVGGAVMPTIVNVIGGGNYSFALNQNSGASADQSVIWNFVSASSLTTQTELFGSVLAPNSTLTNKNAINGSVVANLFFQQGEVHLGTFGSTLPPPPVTTPVPEPASWITMLLGFGFIGSAVRRRRRVNLAVA